MVYGYHVHYWLLWIKFLILSTTIFKTSEYYSPFNETEYFDPYPRSHIESASKGQFCLWDAEINKYFSSSTGLSTRESSTRHNTFLWKMQFKIQQSGEKNQRYVLQYMHFQQWNGFTYRFLCLYVNVQRQKIFFSWYICTLFHERSSEYIQEIAQISTLVHKKTWLKILSHGSHIPVSSYRVVPCRAFYAT